MGFIHRDFMLGSGAARRLYHEYAKDLPIIDYHCHLSPKMIAENRRFKNITELFLGGDHYKWRAMRSYGVDEKYITGDADDYDKFLKWAETLPHCIGNPLYHWTHLELKRYFDIDDALSPKTADKIWKKTNEMLQGDDFTPQSLIARSGVEILCTTDDPADDLEYHRQIRESGFKVRVLPSFRPDKAVEIGRPEFVEYMRGNGIDSFDGLLSWLRSRIEFFHQNGCRLSDHALNLVPYAEGDPKAAFDKAMSGQIPDLHEQEVYKTAVLRFCAAKYAARGWAMQLHIGALRNNNSRMFDTLGPDAGFDSINDSGIAEPLSRFLDSLEKEDKLPKTILYNLNPKDNYVLAAMIGNFQKAPYKGKLQFGSGWWFNDQRDGMVAQMRALANLGVLGTFVGMLTDSRSFVSYPRHEYFRRILCDLIGGWVERGEYPKDYQTLGEIVQNICYYNAKNYFEF